MQFKVHGILGRYIVDMHGLGVPVRICLLVQSTETETIVGIW
jgi:hypothetical protein